MPEHLHDLDDVIAELDVDLSDEQPVTVDQLLDLWLDPSIYDEWERAYDRSTEAVQLSADRLFTALRARRNADAEYADLTPAERAIFAARIAREDRPSR